MVGEGKKVSKDLSAQTGPRIPTGLASSVINAAGN